MSISNSRIDRIGNIVRKGEATDDYEESIKILNFWREAHGKVMDAYFDKCVNLASQIDEENIIVAERLKRLPTIIGKLNRFKDMRLSSMQDIAGVRIITVDMEQLRAIETELKSWKGLLKIRDYIESPKPSGYRGIHFVFENEGKLVEIQLRTQFQHLWATSVETTDILRGTALKEKDDNSYWHDFFCQVSSIFAIAEKEKVVPGYENMPITEINNLLGKNMRKHSIESQISGFALTNDIITRSNDAYYVVLTFDSERKTTKIAEYKEKEYNLAFNDYQNQESRRTESEQVVMVAVSQIKKLQETYPNYFLKLNEFLSVIALLLEKNKEK